MENNVIVEMKDITKSFPGVKALDSVSLTLRRGSIHALVGENGAGKSTLMKILSGTYKKDAGEVRYKGRVVDFRSEREALDAGISIVPQELAYVPGLTIEENIFLGREPATGGVISKKTRCQKTKELINELKLQMEPTTKMSDISIAQCQMVEIIKAISRGAEVVIMDEPTSSLTTVETQKMFEQVRALKAKGIAVVYISHKLDEIMELCDAITVLRDAKLIGSIPRKEASEAKIIQMMVGRDMGKVYPPVGTCGTEEVLRVEGLTRQGVFENISFTLHQGEVLGFSGMVGAGRSEVMRALFGMDPYQSGSIFINKEKVKIRSTQDAIRAGICLVFEDRAIHGFVGDLTVSENVMLPSAKEYSKYGSLDFKRIAREVSGQTELLRIKTPSIHQKTAFLSGGNQQKVVLAKWLIRKDVKVLIMDEPTRGIDIGAKQEIYQIIKDLAAQGMAIIIVSSEMPEVINVSQRIIVMDSGRILDEFPHENATQDGIMKTIIDGGRKL
ncbi:sugar ABC transporter ATP-binding protein [Agathobaculum sp. NTUH-O15-33]|uniref:sugar ABC transporter ATP-binding protein n=1 Tax=Agathobaculum sp. NTUH-O15-33 TaxID=3079302 RepID=UPI0029587797|nr:sugar ABC transporter ATP-binding protein [Agathobaculum sp. NTUH-O15-33]WNX83441.1 sugar ABC transporter ATP-binding protein [Agathobaculum sp. NTUH-O15-33]